MDRGLNKKPAAVLNPSHKSVHLIFTVTVMTPVSQVSTLRLGKEEKKNESPVHVHPTHKWPNQDWNPDNLKLEPELINAGSQLKRKQGTKRCKGSSDRSEWHSPEAPICICKACAFIKSRANT